MELDSFFGINIDKKLFLVYTINSLLKEIGYGN